MAEEKNNKTLAEEKEKVVEEKDAPESQVKSSKDNHEKDVEKGEKREEKKKKSLKDKKEAKIKELELKVEELSDKHLRLQAEFDNYRRRTLREKADLIKSGGESVFLGIIPVVDDFERAIDSMKDIPDDDAGKQGTLLIYNKFKDFLKQNSVKEIDSLHKDFDVDLHEAITKIPVEDQKLKGKIVEIIQKGYTLNDKVIRFARVVVGE